ncbi:MAG: double-strand break repair helicase AddA [Filomicrobium sp.]
MGIDQAIREAVQKELQSTTERQRSASDPLSSAWVSANAGTGKTHVLTMRSLRLLLAGTSPERILCLTYTKAAAAQMSTRVFDRLARWVTETDEQLRKELGELLGRDATSEEMLTARTLFTRAIETPGGLKVQTIHAFCERLLQRFPMEAGIPPGFATLDDDLGRTLKREAIDRTLQEGLGDPDSPVGQALSVAVGFAGEQRFEDILGAAIMERRWLEQIERAVSQDAAANTRHAEYEARLQQLFGVRPNITLSDIETDMAGVLSDALLAHAISVLSEGKKTDMDMADRLAQAKRAASPREKTELMKLALLTKEGAPRARVPTKAIQQSDPALVHLIESAQSKLARLVSEANALRCIEATLALVELASRVQQHYTDAKARRAALDFDDLIENAVNLLGTQEATDWVLYKLDGGLDHILVDESQDTSPNQWRIVEALATEFFSGEGARETETPRTLFAVGDEKQSIYSFQGAAPEMFAEMGAKFAGLAERAGQPMREVPLDLSFRTVEPVLNAVDHVFADPKQPPGVVMGARKIHHAVKRLGEAGLIEIWPTEKPEDKDNPPPFDPLIHDERSAPVDRLAARIADTIKGWLENGEVLQSKGRPITAGDVLILCRKRRPFAIPMVSALKARGIPVAGADRLVLTEQLAVQDLMALGDFTTLPDDDLTLAAVLKSPIIGLTEDDLFEIAHGRKVSLWKALIDKQAENSSFKAAVSRLVELRQRADFLPPFEFYAKALDDDGLRRDLLARLGPEAADPIDEFLNLAIAYDDQQAPSLTGFLSWLREADREIKRDMEQGANEVRVMTVHASKGLEAPIVFLPDTCNDASAGGATDPIAELQADEDYPDLEPPRVWKVKNTSSLAAIQSAKTDKAAREQQELNRLLYVAMTRAEDRLYVGGFEGARGRAQDCWYDSIQSGLEGVMQEVERADGETVLRLEASQLEKVELAARQAETTIPVTPPPDWASRNAPRVPLVTLPLAPSQLVPYDSDPEGEPQPGPIAHPPADVPDEPPVETQADLTGETADIFLRGTLTHALFEHLPDLPANEREAAATAYLEARGRALAPYVRKRMVSEVMSILEDKQFAPLFGPRSRAEVAVAAKFERPDGRQPALELSGSIDRLAEVGDEILIVDFKTNRNVPSNPNEVAEAYLLQLASYRLALAEIYPGRPIRTALLWTRVPALMAIPDENLTAAEERLWELSLSSS